VLINPGLLVYGGLCSLGAGITLVGTACFAVRFTPHPPTHPPTRQGGYNAWYNTFDNKLKRRVYGEYAEAYKHDGDSCGIHASGAGFARVDAIERITLPVY